MLTTNCFKPTSDDWCDNYQGDVLAGFVRVSFVNNEGSIYQNRVCVGGNDDCMSAFEGPEAERMFLQLLALFDLTKQAVAAIGLKPE